MSNLSKSEQISALKTLQTDLKNVENSKKLISFYQSDIDQISRKSYSDTTLTKLSTNNYENQMRKYREGKQKRNDKQLTIFFVAAVIGLIALIVLWIVVAVSTKSTYLHTPEIIGKYSGTYYSYEQQYEATINITSCSKSGKIEGDFEFSTNRYSDDIYGKYKIKGWVTEKSKDGDVSLTIEGDEWIEKPYGYRHLDNATYIIHEDYKILRSTESNMCLYASDYKQPTTVSNLETPEILGTYKCQYNTCDSSADGGANITINSCDATGKVTGILDYKDNEYDTPSKWEVSGQITEKYDNGSLKLTLTPGQRLEGGATIIKPPVMELFIYDNYRSVYSEQGAYYLHHDEFFSKDPDYVVSPYRKMMPPIFFSYLGIAIVLFIILAGRKNDKLTDQEKQRLDELARLDEEHKKQNETAKKQHIAQAKQEDQKLLAQYKSKLEDAENSYEQQLKKVKENTVISPDDKTLSNVEFLIYRLETGRADTVKEALLQLDESNRRTQSELLRMEREFQESRRRRQAEAEAYVNQKIHNLTVEREQRRQSDELERIRKAMEDK